MSLFMSSSIRSQVIFLIGLVSMILMRTLRKDYARYSKDEEMDDMERDLGDEYGWKQVRMRFRSTCVSNVNALSESGMCLTIENSQSKVRFHVACVKCS